MQVDAVGKERRNRYAAGPPKLHIRLVAGLATNPFSRLNAAVFTSAAVGERKAGARADLPELLKPSQAVATWFQPAKVRVTSTKSFDPRMIGILNEAVSQTESPFSDCQRMSSRGVMRRLSWLVVSSAKLVDSHTFIGSHCSFQQCIRRTLQVLIEKRAGVRCSNFEVQRGVR